MIVSLDWLREYVDLPMTSAELADRLALAGLNHERFDDEVIDLEVTSNRADCLGHIGVAREVSVLWDQQLRVPSPQLPKEAKSELHFGGITIECPDLCQAYSAHVLRGVKVGPSPAWLANRLRAIGIAVINNVVDTTNYVMMECGQPLHAFDFAKLKGGRIIVREPKGGEKFEAINHTTYELSPGICVIADAARAVALGGVMGGAESEVSDATTDLLIEAAIFDPLTTRKTARLLNLHSPSSYRFERGVDERQFGWAAARCCQLILETGGGELVAETIELGRFPQAPPIIKLRFDQLPRVLGIKVPDATVQRILTALGCKETHVCGHCVKVVPPSWRSDLTREIDLIEEVARIYGYEQIPEDVGVRMAASTRSRLDRVVDRVRGVMTGAGFDEAMTLSAVEEGWTEAIRPWTDAAPLETSTPVLRRADRLRQTLVPSLLAARRHNEKLSNPRIELFEIAKVYLPRVGELPLERRVLSLTSGGDYLAVKGVIEAVVGRLAPTAKVQVGACALELLDDVRSGTLTLGGEMLGFMGEVSAAGKQQFELRGATTVAEIDLELLIAAAELKPQAHAVSPYPPIARDLNIVFDEAVRWADVERFVRGAGGETLESVEYQETYRNPERIGAGKKSVVFGVQLRSATGTLTNEEADGVRDKIVAALAKELGGALRA